MASKALSLAVGCALAGAASAQDIVPRVFTPLPTGSVTPKGWLLKQLRLQAEGLSGHLSMFWNDIKETVWIGGTGDGGLHERTPYWLNGVVPLSYLLKNAGGQHILPGVRGVYKAADGFGHGHDTPLVELISDGVIDATNSTCQQNVDMMYHDISKQAAGSQDECYAQCAGDPASLGWVWDECDKLCWCKNALGVTNNASCRCFGTMPPRPIPAVNMSAQVETYMDYILSHQTEDGWLGPPDEEASQDGNKWWGRSNVLLAMCMYAEAEPSRFDAVTTSMKNYMLLMEKQLSASSPALTDWAAARWMDLVLSTQWMLLNAKNLSDDDRASLWNLATLLHEQGQDWETWFHTFGSNDTMHNVNLAQALKSAAVWYGMTDNATLRYLSEERMHRIDHEWGLPTGMFNGDEWTPAPHTRNPSRGIELCGVVEAMFSYNTMFSVFGNVAFADRAERVAYNALPATWASPTGGDMWAHQYLQAVNEINAIKADPHVWTHDGDDAETYGLEPNYGCCTANFNQGWPKFAHMIVYTTQDNGVAVGAYAPVTADAGNGIVVDVDTAYPFEDAITVTVSGNAEEIPVYLRIPGWAVDPNKTLNGEPIEAANGTMLETTCKAGAPCTFELDFKPAIRVEEWGDFAANGSRTQDGPYSIHRGALMYALPLGLNFTQNTHYFGPVNDSSQSSNDYEIRPTSDQPWNVAIDLDVATPEQSLSFHQGAYGKDAAAFNHSGWPCNISGTVRVVPGWVEADNSASAPPASPACVAADANCGPASTAVFVPYGGTDLRVSELPSSGLSGKQAKALRQRRLRH